VLSAGHISRSSVRETGDVKLPPKGKVGGPQGGGEDELGVDRRKNRRERVESAGCKLGREVGGN